MCAKCPSRGTATTNNNWDTSVAMSTRPSFTKHLTIQRMLINIGLKSRSEAKCQWSLQAPFRKVLSRWFTLCHLTVIDCFQIFIHQNISSKATVSYLYSLTFSQSIHSYVATGKAGLSQIAIHISSLEHPGLSHLSLKQESDTRQAVSPFE